MQIDLPEVIEEVKTEFERYEQALVSNDIATLNEMFRNDARTIRYGLNENLYGYAEIAAFRAARSPLGLARTLSKTVISSYGAIMPWHPRCITEEARLERLAGRCRPGSDSRKVGEWWPLTSA